MQQCSNSSERVWKYFEVDWLWGISQPPQVRDAILGCYLPCALGRVIQEIPGRHFDWDNEMESLLNLFPFWQENGLKQKSIHHMEDKTFVHEWLLNWINLHKGNFSYLMFLQDDWQSCCWTLY